MEPDSKSLQLCKTKIYYYIRRWSVEQIMPYFQINVKVHINVTLILIIDVDIKFSVN